MHTDHRFIRVPFDYRGRTHWVLIDPASAANRPVQRAPLVTAAGRVYRYVTLRFDRTPHLTATVID
jgi:hypothetical protein